MTPFVRQAEAYDIGPFLDLWRVYLLDSSSDARPTLKSMDFFAGLFNAYTSGAARGAIGLMDHDSTLVGAVMWGEPIGGMGFDHSMGDVAIGWGTFVDREYRENGYSRLLREWAAARLITLGFDSILGSVKRGNVPAQESVTNFGMAYHSVNVYMRLWR